MTKGKGSIDRINTKLSKEEIHNFPSWQLTDRQLCDLELIINGGFTPLKGFLGIADYNLVLNEMRLADGSLWPIPITLDVTKQFSESIEIGDSITLRDKEGFAIAVLVISDIWIPDLMEEAQAVFGTVDDTHPGVHYLFFVNQPVYLGGEILGITLPHHYDFKEHRHSPNQLKSVFMKKGWKKVIAFQTRNPLHKAHVEITNQAVEQYNASLLIHPAVGITKPGDVDYYTRVRCYKHILTKYSSETVLLSLLPIAMRMAGPREALWHGLIRKNYGCTHLIVGRNHADPGKDKNSNPFYGSYDAQELLKKHQDEIGIEMIPFKFMVYLPEEHRYKSIDDIDRNTRYNTISGTKLREFLKKGERIPEWFTYPEVARELERSYPPLIKRGFTIFFTGLSGAGKSTLAKGLLVKLMQKGERPVTLLDGDIIRTHLSSELGFSKVHRSINVKRIGFVASEITKNGGIAICAPIAPYQSDRHYNRELIEKFGGYIEIYVNTPLEKCESRDSKGLYAKARKGLIKDFTGISDPYEIPEHPSIVIKSSGNSPEILVDQIYKEIKKFGFIN